MTTSTRQISELRYAEYNPRAITDTQFAALQRSIKEFGFIEPVVINMGAGRENTIIGGHMRTRAAQLIGYSEVPVVEVYLDEQHEKLLNIALNRISGSWDQDKLAELVVTLQQDGADVTLTGLERDELRVIVDDQVPIGAGPGSGEPVLAQLTLEYDESTMAEVMRILSPLAGATLSEKALTAFRSLPAPAADVSADITPQIHE